VVGGTRIAFVGYHQFFTTDDSGVIAAIASAKQEGDFVIVYPHWGEEYSTSTTPFQNSEAHKFVDSGADVVLGSHPHVAEPLEVYKEKAIFYSMGNFVFDQSWSKETSEGVAIRLTIGKEQVSYEVIPLVITHAQPSIMPHEDALKYLSSHGLEERFVLQR
jgi:poly-gamma-glutamate synthesis protein (capsule biosynthesis protein)